MIVLTCIQIYQLSVQCQALSCIAELVQIFYVISVYMDIYSFHQKYIIIS